MQDKIKYTGITTRPSSPESPDGDLGLSINLINEDGGLKPILPLEKAFSLDYRLQGEQKYTHRLLYVHKVQNTTMYIIFDGGSNRIIACKLIEGLLDPVSNIPISAGDNIIFITSIGSTLIISTEHRISYALFKDGKYVDLGEKPPFIELSFGLTGVAREQRFILFDSNKYTTIVNGLDFFESINGQRRLKRNFSTSSIAQKNKPFYESALTDELMLNLNEFVNSNSIEKGMFMMPFFVRYAYRMYDGTHIMHSAPIFMIPNSNIMATISGGVVNSYATIDAQLFAVSCNLNVCSYSADEDIKKWGDIITGIDIFISAPVYTYDQNGKVTGWEISDPLNKKHYLTDSSFNNTKAPSSDYGKIGFQKGYATNNFPSVFMALMGANYPGDEMMNESNGYRYPNMYIKTPKKEDLNTNITSTSLFYKVTTLSFDDVFAYTEDIERKTLDISAIVLRTLEQRERLADDYISHNKIKASCSYVYNARLHLADVSHMLFNGFSTTSMLQYNSVYADSSLDEAFVFIKKEGKEYILREATWSKRSITDVRYLFYPDPDAYKIVLKYKSWTFDFSLTPHNLLNGAYWFGNLSEVPLINKPASYRETTNKYDTPSKLLTSSVNNPFVFTPEGINSVGTNAKIMAISSTTKALSQGQFGQFPLYIFKEDGVWSVAINNNGSFGESKPVTRDVINNTELLQVDGGIIFSTEQGLKLINGAESISISDIINDVNFDTTKLPRIEDVLLAMNKKKLLHNIVLFKEYLLGCKMAYDYTNSRVYVTNKNHNYIYIYSLRSNSWSIRDGSFVDVVNNYPTSLIIDKDMNVYDVSQYKTEITPGLLVTRPLKLGAPDTLKTIQEVIHRSLGCADSNIKTALYGSIDCQKYYLISSSNSEYIRRIGGTPYKYFIFVIGVDLNFGQELLGTSLTFDIKRDNKLR